MVAKSEWNNIEKVPLLKPTEQRNVNITWCICHIYMGKTEISLGKLKFRAIPFEKFSKEWAVIWGDVILIFSAYLDILCSGSFSNLVKFYSFMFMYKISTRVACVNCMTK